MNKREFTRHFLFAILDMLKVSLSKPFPFLYNFFKLQPSTATLGITDNCCFRCIMCNQWRERTNGELSEEKWTDILLQLKEIGIKSILLAGGGEPFLRKDITSISSFAHNMGLEVGVITNGYLLNRERIEESIEKGVNTFCVSVDAVGEKFDAIRGVKGAYDRVLDSCKILSEFKNKGVINTYIHFTLMKPSLDTYGDVFKLAEKFNFQVAINLVDYTPYFFKNLRDNKDGVWITEKDSFKLEEFQKFCSKRKQKSPQLFYHTYTEIEYFRKYFKDTLQKDIPCVTSQQKINIDSQGNVYGGCWSMGSFGNLKEKSLKEIVNSPRYRTVYKNMFFKECPGCSCGYPKNLRYYLPSLAKEALFRIAPFTRKLIWS